jgi:hypothetical protein
MESSSATITPERVQNVIYVIRGERVMVDRDLATLYGVSSKAFNQSVKRHKDRFPEDFMFQLTVEEARSWWLERMATHLRSQSCDLKAWATSQVSSPCFHGAWHPNAIERSE